MEVNKTHLILKGTLITLVQLSFVSGCEKTLMNSIALEEPKIVAIKPREYSGALRNSLKGFRAYSFDHEYGTLWHSYIRWNSIEYDENDGMWPAPQKPVQS